MARWFGRLVQLSVGHHLMRCCCCRSLGFLLWKSLMRCHHLGLHHLHRFCWCLLGRFSMGLVCLHQFVQFQLVVAYSTFEKRIHLQSFCFGIYYCCRSNSVIGHHNSLFGLDSESSEPSQDGQWVHQSSSGHCWSSPILQIMNCSMLKTMNSSFLHCHQQQPLCPFLTQHHATTSSYYPWLLAHDSVACYSNH